MKKHLVFIVNPKSGTDRVKAVADAIEANIDKAVYTYDIAYTNKPKHGVELAREAAVNGAFAVVAIGGDGSVNDVAAGLAGSDTALAIIPKGSGNGMARTLGIPMDMAKAIAIINRGKTIQIDLGYAHDRLFVSNAGVGFDARVAGEFAASNRRGLFVYSWLTTKLLWLYRSPVYTITVDGKTVTEKAFLINVANGQQFGYNFKIAPDASWTDGLLDVVVIKRFPKLLGGLLVWRAVRGTILKSRYVSHYRGKDITIHHPELKLMQTDGDVHPCGDTVRFLVQEQIQKVIVP